MQMQTVLQISEQIRKKVTFINPPKYLHYMPITTGSGVSTFSENMRFLKDIFTGGVVQFLIAVTTLIIGFIIGKILGKLIEKLLNSVNVNSSLKRSAGITYPISEIIGIIISYCVYAITVLLVLKQLHLTDQVVNIVIIITLVIIIVSIILGAKDFTPNFMAGIMLHTKKYLEEGDLIKFRDVEGKVIRISMLETLLETKSKEIIYVPNSLLVKAELVKIRKKKYGEEP